jgi:hypothetical protein
LVVDLDFSQFSYSGGVYTIRNLANAAAPAYMYGGLGWNVPGSDSSGVSRDGLTGRVVINTDGSYSDSAILSLPVPIDTMTALTYCVDVKRRASSYMAGYLICLRSAANANGSAVVAYIFQDSVGLGRISTAGVVTASNRLPNKFALHQWYHVCLVDSIFKCVLYINNDSVCGITSTTRRRAVDRVLIGSNATPSSARTCLTSVNHRLFGRKLTSAERTVLYNNSLRDIHDKKKFSRW